MVVAATGAVPAVPDVPGLEEIRAYTALDILEVDLAELGENVLVVGGLNDHLAPLAAADLLADRGKQVVLLSECILPGQAAEPSILHLLTKRLLEKRVRIEALTQLVKGERAPRYGTSSPGRPPSSATSTRSCSPPAPSRSTSPRPAASSTASATAWHRDGWCTPRSTAPVSAPSLRGRRKADRSLAIPARLPAPAGSALREMSW